LSGSPAASTSALHPHPVQAPQNWPCTTGPGQLLSVSKHPFQLRRVHSTVNFSCQVLQPIPPQPSTLIQHKLLKAGPADQGQSPQSQVLSTPKEKSRLRLVASN